MPMPSSRSEKANGRKLKEQYPHTRVEVLPNGVDYRRFASADGACVP